MFHVWLINIGIVVISLIIAGLIAYELITTRSLMKSKLTSVLLGLGIILVAQELMLLTSFMMWASQNGGPMYAYPSMGIAILSLIGLILLYLVVKM